jgi:hypothetical protein
MELKKQANNVTTEIQTTMILVQMNAKTTQSHATKTQIVEMTSIQISSVLVVTLFKIRQSMIA